MPDSPRRSRLNLPDVFPPIAEDHAAAIGHVAINWSSVDGAITYLLGALLKIDGPARHVVRQAVTELGAVSLVNGLILLSDNVQIICDWQSLMVRHEKLRPERNRAIHSEWTKFSGEHIAVSVSKRNKKRKGLIQFSAKQMPTKQLDSLAEKCLILSEDIMKFCTSVITENVPNISLSLYPPGLYKTQVQTQSPQQPFLPDDPKHLAYAGLSSGQKRKLAVLRLTRQQLLSLIRRRTR